MPADTRNRARRMVNALLMLLALALLLAACQETQTIGREAAEARDTDRTLLPLDAGATAHITIRADLGNITIQPGERTDRVDLTWTRIAYAASERDAEDELDDVAFRFEQDGSTITLDARQSTRSGERTNRVDLTLLVPETVRLTISAATGTVRLNDLTAPDGLRVMVTTGELLVNDVHAPDGLTLTATTGAILFNGTIGDSGLYTLETTTGSLTVRLPAAAAFDVDAQTTTGSIRVTGFDLVGGEPGASGVGQQVSGAVNGGGPELTLRVTTGDIRLEPAR